MIGMGLDIAKTATGWAVSDGARWDSGVLRCPIKKPFELERGKIDAAYTADVVEWFDRELYALVGQFNPTHAAIEQPMPGNSMRMKTTVDTSTQWAGQVLKKEQVGGTAFDVTHFLHGLPFVALRIFRRKNIKVQYVASQTWRSTTGVGRPPKGTKDNQRRAWLKNKAKEICGLRGIAVTAPDQAEACLLTVHLLAVENPRLAGHAADLFRRSA